MESGVFHGLEGARKVFVDMLGKLYHYEGNCAIHELTTPIIQVQKDMNTAKGMWFHVGFNTFLDPVKGVIPIWQVIKYNHIFVKEDGQWKFWDYRAHLLIRSSFEKGWVDEPVIQGSAIQGSEPADGSRAGRAHQLPRALSRALRQPLRAAHASGVRGSGRRSKRRPAKRP